MRLLLPVLLVAFWAAACVVVRFDSAPPPANEWKFVPMPELDSDGCCIEDPSKGVEPPRSNKWILPAPEVEPVIDLKKGPHIITFADVVNPLIGWPIDHYALYDQWGDVIAKIQPNARGRYVVKGVPRGCFYLRAIGQGRAGDVPSGPSNEGCTPGIKKGRIWT